MVKSSRPAELFYARLVHALQEAGVDVSLSRKAWPLPVLTKVLQQLMREVPKQLLARELWAGAGGAAGWWRRQRRHAASGAAASVVGYLLGVGDRHLDNILLDLRSAELLHIDFNVCFDKGARLRVPEVVPFRLTQTLQVGRLAGWPGALPAAWPDAQCWGLEVRQAASKPVVWTVRGYMYTLCTMPVQDCTH
jgi:hypothetical protein